MKRTCIRLAACCTWLMLTAFVTLAQAATTDLVACGMEVQGNVQLVADLDCSAQPLPSVTFNGSGKLILNGFTLTGELYAEAGILAVVGPGTITGPGYGVRNLGDTYSARIKILGASIVGNADSGVVAYGDLWRTPASAKIIDSVISDNGGAGISVVSIQRLPNVIPRSALQILRSTVDDNLYCGASATHFTVKDSSVSGNGTCGISIGNHTRKRAALLRSQFDYNGGAAVECDFKWVNGSVALKEVSMIGNEIGVHYIGHPSDDNRLKIKNSTIRENDYGLLTALNDLRVRSSEISDNRIAGISYIELSTRALVLRDTMALGNGTDAGCGIGQACADIDSGLTPSLDSTSSCDLSHVQGSGVPGTSWGVCSLD